MIIRFCPILVIRTNCSSAACRPPPPPPPCRLFQRCHHRRDHENYCDRFKKSSHCQSLRMSELISTSYLLSANFFSSWFVIVMWKKKCGACVAWVLGGARRTTTTTTNTTTTLFPPNLKSTPPATSRRTERNRLIIMSLSYIWICLSIT